MLAGLAAVASRLDAQGISTTGFVGVVRDERGEQVDGAQVQVLNHATGYSLQTSTRRGRFRVSGLEVGGPYAVTVRLLGYAPLTRDSVFLQVGEPRLLEFVLEPLAQSLDVVTVASRAGVFGADGTCRLCVHSAMTCRS